MPESVPKSLELGTGIPGSPTFPLIIARFEFESFRGMMRILSIAICLIACFSVAVFAQNKPKLTLDEFFNAVYFRDTHISPDGNAVVFATERADWDNERFRDDLWLYRTSSGNLVPLTQSGHDPSPQWSPD